MAILRAQHATASRVISDRSRVVADLCFRDDRSHHELITVGAEALRQTLVNNKGLGILAVQLPEDLEPRKVIIDKLVQAKDGTHLTHLVLKEVSDTDRIRSQVPVVAIGQLPEITSKHAVLVQKRRSVALRGPVGSLDHPLLFNVKKLAVGDQVLAKDLELPRGVTLDCDENDVILHLRPLPQS